MKTLAEILQHYVDQGFAFDPGVKVTLSRSLRQRPDFSILKRKKFEFYVLMKPPESGRIECAVLVRERYIVEEAKGRFVTKHTDIAHEAVSIPEDYHNRANNTLKKEAREIMGKSVGALIVLTKLVQS